MRHLTSLCAALILALALPPAPPTSRAAPHPSAEATITADPASLTVTVPLGERATQTLRLAGVTQPGGVAVFEAQPAAPKALHTGPARVPLPPQRERIDPAIAAEAAKSLDGRADFVVFLNDQADLSAAYAIRDWAERGRFVYRTLTEHAERTQRDLRAALAARGVPFQPLWIVNAVRVRGTQSDIQAIAARADVALLRANRIHALPPLASPKSDSDLQHCSPDEPANPVCWNIRRIGADRVWREFGVDGSGVTVANIDTGVVFDHSALARQYRGNLGAGEISHSYNWFDPQGSLLAPTDTNGHGTHTMGTIVGRGAGTPELPSFGVAPGARWIAAQGCQNIVCPEFDLIAAAQWLLAPTDLAGENPRPDLRPMIVNNSWAGAGGNDWYAGYTAAWRAAGIFPVFAAGNADTARSQSCSSISSPGDYPDVVAVGATDSADTVANFSLLGPAADGRLKPDFVAPGTHTAGQVGILSAYYPDTTSYRDLQGTSMAAPHVTGLVALLWSANPELIGDYDATYEILRATALPVSDTRCGDPLGAPNNVYGHGRIDAYGAVALARVDVPWLELANTRPAVAADGSAELEVTLAADRTPGPGTYSARLQIYGADLGQPPVTIPVTMIVTPIASPAIVTGRVLSADSGQGLAATVGALGGLGVATDSSGAYTLVLKPGEYTLTASALSYLPGTQVVDAQPGTTQLDIVLQPDQPRIGLSAAQLSAELAFGQGQRISVTLTNPGRRTLHYAASAPTAHFTVRRSDSGEPDAPAFRWVDLPSDAPRLELGNDTFVEEVPLGISFPFYSYVFTETLVTSDGMLTFDVPFGYHGPTTRCFPADEIGFYLIAPLRADLDPERGGAVRYGTVGDGQTFVLSYEGVPRDDGPADETYTFQALLHRDGRIVFQYKSLPPPIPAISAGVQRSPWDYQEIGCGAGLALAEGLAIELRPQPPSSEWLAVIPAEGALGPGEQAQLEVLLSWTRPSGPGPYRASVRLTSNDPRSPTVTLPVEVRMLPAPYEQALPAVLRP